jgi:short-subunit dehydrogenase
MNLQELVQLYDMTGRTVVITGGAGILSSEMACALVGCRANVAILDRDQALAERLVYRIQQAAPNAGRAICVYGDVLAHTTLVEVDKIIQGEFSQVNALINAAGGNRATATTVVFRFAQRCAAFRV